MSARKVAFAALQVLLVAFNRVTVTTPAAVTTPVRRIPAGSATFSPTDTVSPTTAPVTLTVVEAYAHAAAAGDQVVVPEPWKVIAALAPMPMRRL